MVGKMTKHDKKIEELHKQGLSARRIAFRLNISHTTVNNRLRALGLKTPQKFPQKFPEGTPQGGGVSTLKKSTWRLHGFQFLIRPYHLYPRYIKMLKTRGNQCYIGKWRYMFHDNTIQVYMVKGAEVAHESKYTALELLNDDFETTLNKAAQWYGFEYMKERQVNIKLCKYHIGVAPSDVGKSTKDKILVHGKDGRVWFVIDKSKGVHEHEYTHTDKALDDSEVMEPWLNDRRQYPDLPHDSEIWRVISAIAHHNKDTAVSMAGVAKILSSLVSGGNHPQQSDTASSPPVYIG